MSHRETPAHDSRVLVLAPTSKDAAVTHALLRSAGIDSHVCRTFDDLVLELKEGAGAILVPEGPSRAAQNATLAAAIGEQPPWSDLPVLVMTRLGADSSESGEAVRTLGNVTLLERPLRVTTLLSAVRTALRARTRQYQIRGHLEERALAEEALREAISARMNSSQPWAMNCVIRWHHC